MYVTAIASAVSATSPAQPNHPWTWLKMTCASHCVDIQGWPCIVNEYTSVTGTVR